MKKLEVLFQNVDSALEVLFAKLTFEEATVRLRNLELEASVQNSVLDDFSTLEFQFLAQLENSEKRAQQYKTILLDSQQQLLDSKQTEETLKGSLLDCENKLAELRVASDQAKKAHQEALERVNDPQIKFTKRQLRRKEADLNKMRKEAEKEKKELESKICSVQDQCSQLEQRNNELQCLLDRERDSRSSLHLNMRVMEKDKRCSFETQSLRKSLQETLSRRSEILPDQEAVEDPIDLQREDEVVVIPAEEDSPVGQESESEEDSSSDEDFVDVKVKSPEEEEARSEGVMTRARRRETLAKQESEQVMVENSKQRQPQRRKPPFPSRLFGDPMTACNDQVKAASAENQNPEILAVNPFVIPVVVPGQHRGNNQGAKRKLGPRSASGTVITGNSDLSKELQGIEDRRRRIRHNPSSKKWQL